MGESRHYIKNRRKNGKTIHTEERLEAVLMSLRKEDTGAKIARRFGISENSLRRYREHFLESIKSGLRSGTNS